MKQIKHLQFTLPFVVLLFVSGRSNAQVDTTAYVRNGETFSFTVDTLNTNGDSTFVVVNGFYDNILAFHNQTIFLPNSCIIHGLSTHFYPNGVKKCEGNYVYGFKTNNWKYWNVSGREISESEFRKLTDK